MHEGFDSYQCLKVEIQPTNMGSTLRYRFETWDFTISNTKNLRTWVQYHGIYMKFDLTWGMGLYGIKQVWMLRDLLGRSGNDNTTALEMMPSKGNYPKMVELGGLCLQ